MEVPESPPAEQQTLLSKADLLVDICLDRHSFDDLLDALALGASLSLPAHSGQTPLTATAQSGWVAAAEELIDRGADVNEADWAEVYSESHCIAHQTTPLSTAALHARVDVARLLLARGAQADEQCSDLAAFGGSAAIFELVDKGDDRDAASWAARGGHLEVIEWLAQRGNPDIFDWEMAQCAIEFGRSAVLEWLVARGSLETKRCPCFTSPYAILRLDAVERALALGFYIESWTLFQSCGAPHIESARAALLEAEKKRHSFTFGFQGEFLSRYLPQCRDAASAEWYVRRAIGPVLLHESPRRPTVVRRLCELGVDIAPTEWKRGWVWESVEMLAARIDHHHFPALHHPATLDHEFE